MTRLAVLLVSIVALLAAAPVAAAGPVTITSGPEGPTSDRAPVFAFTGTAFSIMALIGMLVLMGVVVNNGIVMVEHINALRRQGYNRTDALVAGSQERLRPILMTMGTTILGMLPLSFAGASIGGGRWTSARKEAIRESRFAISLLRFASSSS